MGIHERLGPPRNPSSTGRIHDRLGPRRGGIHDRLGPPRNSNPTGGGGIHDRLGPRGGDGGIHDRRDPPPQAPIATAPPKRPCIQVPQLPSTSPTEHQQPLHPPEAPNRPPAYKHQRGRGGHLVWRRNATSVRPSPDTTATATSPDTTATDTSSPNPVTTSSATFTATTSYSSSSSSSLKVCRPFVVAGTCPIGDTCKDLHSCFTAAADTPSCFTLLSSLQRHQKTITGITLPAGTDKLISASNDGSLLTWDCNTGQCVWAMDLGAPARCLISDAPWVFVGMSNAVRAWNTPTGVITDLAAPHGDVYALAERSTRLFAGTHDGTIVSWNYTTSTSDSAAEGGGGSHVCFQPALSLVGHRGPVVSLVCGDTNRLYSASVDSTIKVWDWTTSQCIQTLTGHTDVVTSVLLWEHFLLSCSLDGTIRVWANTHTEDGSIKIRLCHTHTLDYGLLAMDGIHAVGRKPILICSSINDTVHLYDLPSLADRGTIFSKEEVRALYVHQEGRLFFTGDATGDLKVWKLITEEPPSIMPS